jgi:hypothetical protein
MRPSLKRSSALVAMMFLSCATATQGPARMDGASKAYFKLPYMAKMDSQWSANLGTRFERRGVVVQGTKICLVRPPLHGREEWTHGLSLDGSEIWIRSEAVEQDPSSHNCPPKGPG